MGVGWVRWSMSISSISTSIWVSSIESSIWVTGISVVEVSWISISLSITLGNNVSGSIWESSVAVSSIGYWGGVVVSVSSWCSNDCWGGKSLNFYFSWFYFNSFDDSRCTIWVSSIWVSSISVSTVW